MIGGNAALLLFQYTSAAMVSGSLYLVSAFRVLTAVVFSKATTVSIARRRSH